MVIELHHLQDTTGTYFIDREEEEKLCKPQGNLNSDTKRFDLRANLSYFFFPQGAKHRADKQGLTI